MTYISAIIGVAGTILGIVVGFLLKLFEEQYKENAKLKSELQSAINEILFVTVTNNYPSALSKLRTVIIKNAHVIKNDKLISFYRKWLTNPVLMSDMPVSNLYSSEQTRQLISELSEIKL